jgi:hypothetical protein
VNAVNHIITLYVLETVDDAVEAMASIVVGVANGELTSTEANDLARLVDGFVKAIEASDLNKRITAIEKQLQP